MEGGRRTAVRKRRKARPVLSFGSHFECLSFHSGLNFIDLMVRQGNIDNPPKTPLVPGFECSGIVEALGDSVKGYEVTFYKSDIYLASPEITKMQKHLK